MKTAYSEERRIAIGNLNRGKSLSEFTKAKMREKALLRTPRIFSEQAMANMKKNYKSIVLLNKDGTVYGEYNSIKDSSIAVNCDEKTIRRALASDSKRLKRRLIVKYK